MALALTGLFAGAGGAVASQLVGARRLPARVAALLIAAAALASAGHASWWAVLAIAAAGAG
ncbi:MAG TPA: hypothetical protein VHK88_02700, partial [Aquihabitans sp.]|nr:hypothetical protein [Aquihabitans sp.]